MFSGIVAEVGTIVSLENGALCVRAGETLGRTRVGGSIAVNGVCLTAARIEDGVFAADVMPETLRQSGLGRLGPGALVITCLAPVSAQLLQRNLVSAKTLVFMSLSFIAAAMFVYSNMNLDTNGAHYAWTRALQGVGYGLFLVPVNMIAYSQLRPDQNNKASSLTNLFRNWGGSFGIAFVTTAAERRANLHQLNLGSHLGSSSQSVQQSTQGMVNHLMQYGFTSADAGPATLGVLYQQLLHQSAFLAFMDCFRVIGWLTLAMIPLVILIRKFKGGQAPAGGH